jgi:hypothetical protein
VSPYLRKVSSVSASRLGYLLEWASRPAFLFASSTNPDVLILVLEVCLLHEVKFLSIRFLPMQVFANVLQYQYDSNYDVVYALVQRSSTIRALQDLTLPANAPTSLCFALHKLRFFAYTSSCGPGDAAVISVSTPDYTEVVIVSGKAICAKQV